MDLEDSKQVMNKADNFLSVILYFFERYPFYSLALMAGMLLMSLTEVVGVTSMLPLLNVGLGQEAPADNALYDAIIGFVNYLGIEVSFTGLFILVVALLIARSVINLLLGIFVTYSRTVITRNMRAEVVDSLREVSWSFFTKQPSGIIVNLVSSEVERASSCFTILHKFFTSIFLFVFYLIVGVSVTSPILWTAFAVGAISIIALRPLIRLAKQAGAGQTQHLRDLTSELLQGMMVYKAFKAMSKEGRLLGQLGSHNNKLAMASRMAIIAKRILMFSQEVLVLSVVAVGIYSGHIMMEMSLSEIGFLAVLLLKIYSQISHAQRQYQSLVDVQATLIRMLENLIDMKKSKEVWSGTSSVDRQVSIKFENVEFSYDEEEILKGTSFTLLQGSFTTLVGPTGAGKTTVVDLLCGFYKPNKGRVLVNDTDLQLISLQAWREKIGYVTQEPLLLNDTIYNNVAAFADDISDEKVKKALIVSGAWPFVERLPDGWHTSVGERGAQFSGGERQRIAIARALAQEPSVLILDEPTAAVDAKTERAICEAFKKLKGTMTIIAISHQPAIAAIADQVLEIDNGVIKKQTR